MRLKSVNIQGYRHFRNLESQLESLEIIVGANGAGKSSFFEFLKFLRDSVFKDIPPEIISGSIGQQIFHIPGTEKFQWDLEIDTGLPIGIRYLGEIMGTIGRLFEKASERTQILLATHSSYFLTQFDISQIAVLRKENGEAKFIKPGNSPILIDMLDDFGADEIEQLHRSDELERLP